VLGRKKLGVKICSCPRRDMLKEEDFEKNIVAGMKMIKKRTLPDNDNSILKKILKSNNENDQNAIYELPAVCIFILINNFNPNINCFYKLHWIFHF